MGTRGQGPRIRAEAKGRGTQPPIDIGCNILHLRLFQAGILL